VILQHCHGQPALKLRQRDEQMLHADVEMMQTRRFLPRQVQNIL